ncbi:hypothetical protein M0R72_17060 [Candidatus Pacearchaeota archaeon]|jgi:hypothetical protein|nr:hypothetical protein [Candidatus Pacearchaeota archaeon]
MNTIRFSHFYNKLPRDYQYSRLLQVIPIRLSDLSAEFRHYDTAYLDGGEERQYPLPASGNYMILLLQSGSGHGKLWTTIRAQFDTDDTNELPVKLVYYQSLVGKIFECKVVE